MYIVTGTKRKKAKKRKGVITEMNQIKRLEAYPILHRFLARLYSELEIFEVEDMFAFIADDRVSSYCKCKDSGCASFFVSSDRELEIDEDDGVYVYDSDKGTIVLEFFENGDIDVQALEYEHYPFKEELITVYNQDDVQFALESDLEEELQQKRVDEAQKVVDEYFKSTKNDVNTIVVE